MAGIAAKDEADHQLCLHEPSRFRMRIGRGIGQLNELRARSIGKYELEIVIASSIVQFPLGWPDLGLQLGSAAISQSINHTPRWPAWIIIISASGC